VKAVLLLVAVLLAAAPSGALTYPTPPTDNTVDDYYGTKVADPYRPLENLDSPQTRAWVEAEASLTRSYLDAIPQRAAIKARIQSLINYARTTVPFHMGSQYFYTHNTGLQNQNVLYTMRGLGGAPRVLIDPNTLSADGSVTLGQVVPSWDARFIAYDTQTSGSDWQTWHVRRVSDGKDLTDALVWSKFSSAAWDPQDRGFFYDRYPTPKAGSEFKSALSDQAVYFHALGTPQSADRLIYFRPEHSNWIYNVSVTDDRRYGILYVSSSDSINNRIGYFDLRDPQRTVRELLWKNDAQWGFVGNAGPVFFFTTTLGSPNQRVVAIDVRRPDAMRTIVPESRDQLQGASAIAHRFVLQYLHDAHSLVKVYALDGRFIRDVPLPGLGTASGFPGTITDRTTFFAYSGYTTPSSIYRYDVVSGASSVFFKPRTPFDDRDFQTTEVFYTSKDGTRVPMMISYRRGTPLDGTAPTILYGYGGFDIAITPAYSSTVAAWMQMGGIYAVANLRGGSEYGETWHKGGMLQNKQHVFDDFIAAAQYLIDNKYTSTPKLAIRGGSNGGLLVGAAVTQRPDLFGAAIAQVGVMDMLRFDKFTIGAFWKSEYGCSTCGEDQFKTLYAYSPYHNLKPGTVYPPTLITTSDHDDRVFPAHSFKFAARMQADQAGSAPILLRVQLKGGHGGGTMLSQQIDETSDIFAFLVKNLGMSLP
jgi:prolyl oligopeptidase